MNLTTRLIIYEVIVVFIVALVEFALIQKHGATLRTLIIIIITTVIPAVTALEYHIWLELRKSHR